MAKLELTFIVLGKRHHARFYAKDLNGSYRNKEGVNGNMRPGLVVNQVVTLPGWTSFFLQSHTAVQGTAKSAHYYALENGMALPENKIKEAVSNDQVQV
jgi:eukaryotic translation initiation factor 2C